MNDNESWKGIGEEIRKSVLEALDSGNFENLGNAVFDTVADTMRTVSEQVGKTVSVNQTRVMSEVTKARQEARRQAEAMKKKKPSVAARVLAPFRSIGSVSNVLLKVFGGIATGLTGAFALIMMLASIVDATLFPLLLFSLGLLAGSIGMILVGVMQKKRLDKAEYYLKLAGNNHYINVSDIAQFTNESKKKVLAELRQFIRQGFYPEGHLDSKGTCLMLDNKIYSEYLEIEKQRRIQAKEAREAKRSEQESIPEQSAVVKTELEQLIAEGQVYIDQLRIMNDHIQGEEISAKLFRLESLLKQIYARLEEHPEQLPQLKKFLEYYLPTTLKLVAAYEEFDAMSEQGPNIVEAKAEIEKTMDTINDAFAELLNRLYRDTAFDVTTDAQVLQTMLAQEGLTGGNDFQKATQ
ncbi:MAG: 5-bromo-4-chloroindolyl phosphate hydrolysis family protein [Acetatifactor sp.]|nr:5-bromo-4-chloroindolyl phosphate hydrolysis family protein [Acetatifactor sp.]